MINPLSGILGGTSSILLLLAMFFWGQWQGAEAELAIMEANNKILENSVATQQVTIDAQLAYQSKQADRLWEKDNELASIRQHTEQQLLTINDLRVGAEIRAWELPFEFGNAHHDRVSTHLMRLSTSYRSQNDLGTAEASNTR